MSVLINFKICDNAEECDGVRVCPINALYWDKKNNVKWGQCKMGSNLFFLYFYNTIQYNFSKNRVDPILFFSKNRVDPILL